MADAKNHITYSLADIRRYLQGDMSAKEMHDLERAALEDPFLADALEGYSEADMQQAQRHLAQIETAILQQEKKSKVVVLPPLEKYRNWQVAASIILLIGIVGISYFIFNKKSNEVALAKAESSSTMPATDSVQMRVQTVSPPTKDTTTLAKKERGGDENGNPSLIAANNIKNKGESRKRAAKAPVQMPAMKEDSNKTAVNASTIIAKPDATNETARTITGNQQQLAAKELKPSVRDQVVIGYGSMKKDTGKAELSASSARVGQLLNNKITGTVINLQQQPVPNAMVTLRGRAQSATTDENGNFSIPTNDSTVVAVISALGYAAKDQELRRGSNNITLTEESSDLSGEVVVAALGIRHNKNVDTTALPLGGWQSFREYVYNKLHMKYDSTDLYDNNGDLQLEFSIKRGGEPFDIKILHAPDTQMANEAIRAIKEGPKWISTTKNRKKRIIVRL